MTHVLDLTTTARSLLRNPTADGVLCALAGVHGAVLLLWPNVFTVGFGLWWNANTVAHYFIHRPFFRIAGLNAAFSVVLSLLLGLPQSVWRDRHLAHHAGNATAKIRPRFWRAPLLATEIAAVALLWLTILFVSPAIFVFAWLPGIALGLALCAVHGHFEHVVDTTSHYGRLYNLLFLNDGYHVEHHASPSCDWRQLPNHRDASAIGSPWPAVLRWLEHPLETLERLVLPRPGLQRFVLTTHRQAWRRLLPRLTHVRRVGIVGGGLFPRTAILLRELLPDADLTVIDADPDNLALARQRLREDVAYDNRWFDPLRHADFDLLVFPLDYRAPDKAVLRERLPAPTVVFHDWIWNARGEGAVVSPWLLKRMNLLRRT